MNTINTLASSNNNTITIDTSVASFDSSTLVLANCNGTYTNDYSFTTREMENSVVIGGDKQTELYVIEKWQSKNPIDMGDGLFTSLKEDLLSPEEIQELIYSKLEEQQPDKAIKLGLNNDIVIRKYMIPLEIKIKD